MTKQTIKFIPTNRNILIKALDNTVALSNGVKVQEERGKKDILAGLVILAEEDTGIIVSDKVYFPMYSATHITLQLNEFPDDDNYLLVNAADILLIERK